MYQFLDFKQHTQVVLLEIEELVTTLHRGTVVAVVAEALYSKCIDASIFNFVALNTALHYTVNNRERDTQLVKHQFLDLITHSINGRNKETVIITFPRPLWPAP